MSFDLRFLFILPWLVCCGSSSQPAKSAPAEEPESQTHAQKQTQTQTQPSAETDSPKESKRASCSDGTCFSCGEAVCLAGYYCAVGKSGHGCAWAPSCVNHPTCACLATTLRQNPSCRCEEKDSGTYVFCDGARL